MCFFFLFVFFPWFSISNGVCGGCCIRTCVLLSKYFHSCDSTSSLLFIGAKGLGTFLDEAKHPTEVYGLKGLETEATERVVVDPLVLHVVSSTRRPKKVVLIQFFPCFL